MFWIRKSTIGSVLPVSLAIARCRAVSPIVFKNNKKKKNMMTTAFVLLYLPKKVEVHLSLRFLQRPAVEALNFRYSQPLLGNTASHVRFRNVSPHSVSLHISPL